MREAGHAGQRTLAWCQYDSALSSEPGVVEEFEA